MDLLVKEKFLKFVKKDRFCYNISEFEGLVGEDVIDFRHTVEKALKEYKELSKHGGLDIYNFAEYIYNHYVNDEKNKEYFIEYFIWRFSQEENLKVDKYYSWMSEQIDRHIPIPTLDIVLSLKRYAKDLIEKELVMEIKK